MDELKKERLFITISELVTMSDAGAIDSGYDGPVDLDYCISRSVDEASHLILRTCEVDDNLNSLSEFLGYFDETERPLVEDLIAIRDNVKAIWNAIRVVKVPEPTDVSESYIQMWRLAIDKGRTSLQDYCSVIRYVLNDEIAWMKDHEGGQK